MRKFALLLFIVFTIYIDNVNAQFCYPVSFGSVIPGLSLEKHVIALFGKGFFDERLGHDGGWYYTNMDKTTTLLITIDVDKYVRSITLSKGLDFGDNFKGDYNLFISKNFELTNNGALKVGLNASKAEILKTYGEPTLKSEDSPDQKMWIYRSINNSNQCQLPNEVWIVFENDNVKKIIILFDYGD